VTDWQLRPIDPELPRRYRAEELWVDRTLGQMLEDGLRTNPHLTFRIWSEQRPYLSTVGDIFEQARRFAAGLAAQGIGPGDVVAFQLPNWVEAAVTFYGVSLLGAVLVPIVHFYGAKELAYILRESGARALVITDRFAHMDYPANLELARPEAPALELVAVIGTPSFTDLLDADPVPGAAQVDPDSPAVVGYTSGTTSNPKGVIHTHNTLVAEMLQMGRLNTTPAGRPMITGAPVGHAIGMMSGLLGPVFRGQAIHLIDVWNPVQVLRAMVEGDLSGGSGATYFLTSLLDAPGFGPEHLQRMESVGLGGSAVPAAVAERATNLGISVIRSYGSTEHPSTTGARHTDPLEKRLNTDGYALDGVDLRLAEDGEIQSRGADLCMGYTDPDLTASAFDADGWYSSGDIGVLDDDGYLTITDRKKDIIIRGGENISAAEVEELLVRMDGVAEVAVVAAPDMRMGEHAAAFLRMQDGAGVPDLEAVKRHLEASGLARQKWPEELHAVDELPRTPSGKIKKFVLRQQLKS
jgi:acyl-CoA synthetase